MPDSEVMASAGRPASGCRECAVGCSRPREHCGIFGAFNFFNAPELTYYGLYALQHRGQESAGVASTDGQHLYHHRGHGLVSDVLGSPEVLKFLKGSVAIGHNRYSTTGDSRGVQNIQPLASNFKHGFLAIGHNGQLVNSMKLRTDLVNQGAIFQSSTDTEVILHLLARSSFDDPLEKIADALGQVRGAYCLVILINDELYAARDPGGYRPLCLGRKEDGWVLASETCALDIIGASYERDVEPGEVLRIGKKGLKSFHPFPSARKQQCVFELMYFSRPDSRIFGHSVDRIRRRFGRRTAVEHPVPGADMVISVPDSSNSHALGFSEQSGVPLELGFIRNHYVGRTFINPTQSIRDISARIKYNPVREVLEGKNVVVVDDSIVRGTTSRRLIKMLRQAGAREVHFRVCSPPIRFPCYYGVDMPTRSELIASSHTVEEIRSYLRVDSLGYLSLEGIFIDTGLDPRDYCLACFNGEYALEFEKDFHKNMHEGVQTSLLDKADF